jgi:anthranilate synthase/aminodeoxychorismate synthase-like glutamine amidotransferase
MLLLIDNFDSFTYNLVQILQEIGIELKVVRNNLPSIESYLDLNPSRLLISPGPGNPSQAGISKTLMHRLAGKIPILGVCLGHQCLAELYGGQVVRAMKPMHGKTSTIIHDKQGIFKDIPQAFIATRYHSLIVKKEDLPSCLKVSAETNMGEIMGLRHTEFVIESVQFHPESILTEHGKSIIQNFLSLTQ